MTTKTTSDRTKFASEPSAKCSAPSRKSSDGFSVASSSSAPSTIVGVGASRAPATSSAFSAAWGALGSRLGGAPPSLLVVAFTCTHPIEQVLEEVHARCPTTLVLGCSSCRGVLANDQWVSSATECALGLWAISDPAGSFEVLHLISTSELASRVEDWVSHEVGEAIAERGEPPRFAIVLSSPGVEEG
eukprot:6654087-Prymnesium_polylepis.1